MQAWSRYLVSLIAAALLLGNLLSACGQKGALYLPEPESDQGEQVDKPGS